MAGGRFACKVGGVKRRPFNLASLALSAALLGALPVSAPAASGKSRPAVDFQREVRPILSRYCFKCHGPDEGSRKGNLRLDLRESALQPAKSGERAVVPGRPNESELIRRVFAVDPDDVMPPPETKQSLSAAEKETLRRWIASGAEYQPHWAFVQPRQVPPPKVRNKRWPQNEIDHFVLARLEQEGLKPSPRADAHTLVRRVYLDLIGLPPTPEEVAEFVHDRSPGAYESLVDRLLASPHYGERWARRWLDLARYADTNGYEKDRPRSIWPWRDWVIKSLNEDLPFDQFTIKQIAGDMLPGATIEDRIATGFHRNTMLNEEGGIDPLEFRYHAMTDRVATTGTTWLGLTTGCAQCHTHKYDPITHTEYFQFMAFLNNADEPEIDLPDEGVAARRREIEARIAKLTGELPEKFPVSGIRWAALRPVQAQAEHSKPELQGDDSVLFAGETPDQETYTITLETDPGEITHLRLEALADERLPNKGPGRAPHGNFVLSEVKVFAAPKNDPTALRVVGLKQATADFSQPEFPVTHAIDGKSDTGWAVDGPGDWNVTRTATFALAEPLRMAGGARLIVRLEQSHGSQHTLGRVRLSVGSEAKDDRPLASRRQEALDAAFNDWLRRERGRAVRWQTLKPVKLAANLALLTPQPDGSIFASGDQSKTDTYELAFRLPAGVRAVRLEAIPDERLPAHGPGATYYEGPKGDFFLGEFQLSSKGRPLKFTDASESYAKNNFGNNPVNARLATDGDPQTGWSCAGRFGERHEAVFVLAEPLAEAADAELKMLFGRHYACPLGRFRLSFTTDGQASARALPDDIQQLLTVPEARLTAEQRERLRRQFLLSAPELAAARAEIEKLRKSLPAYPTTLVMRERPPENPRPTQRHHRGEFLAPKEAVTPAVLKVLHPLQPDMPANRLGFARWLVAPENPLTARVTVNRQWQAFFGQGLVRTLGDFGLQGDSPTHPELLDWLAVEFVKDGWSLKRLHKRIVMSATYQQDSRVTPPLLAKDPNNQLLARAPRVRLEAELVRDLALRVAGQLSPKIGGPSVFPPQPASVTAEGVYQGKAWDESTGEDRYRRGLYTFTKRSAPYAMFATFDAPSGEACVARRDVSDTPLQALTLLNDTVIVEAAQAIGRMMAAHEGTVESRVEYLFVRFLARPPTRDERARLVEFLAAQKARLQAGELDAAKLAGKGEGDVIERAAWAALARALFNLDEVITKG